MDRLSVVLITVVLGVVGCAEGESEQFEVTVLESCTRGEALVAADASVPDFVAMSAEVVGEEKSIRVQANAFSYRCGQEVCVEVERIGSTVRAIFQPCELQPAAAAKCNCPQRLSVTIPADEGQYTVEVYHRSDEHAGPSERELVDTVMVAVE